MMERRSCSLTHRAAHFVWKAKAPTTTNWIPTKIRILTLGNSHSQFCFERSQAYSLHIMSAPKSILYLVRCTKSHYMFYWIGIFPSTYTTNQNCQINLKKNSKILGGLNLKLDTWNLMCLSILFGLDEK